MTIFLRDKDDTNVVDCDIFENRGKIKVYLHVSKSWDYSVELKDLKSKCATLDDVSSIDHALNEVTNTLRSYIKQLAVKMNLRYIED